MGLSWEEMCQKVVIDGRPGDVESAALGWEQLIKNLNSVKQSLDTNIKDLGTTWKGPAYEAFKGHVEQIAKDTGNIVADAEKGTGIVQSLKSAADKLTAAQRDFPIPATCVNDVWEARNAKLTLSVGFFEAKVGPDFLGWLDPVSAIADWINDRSEEAAGVYQRVSGDYQNIAPGTPGDATTLGDQSPKTTIPKLDDGGGSKGKIGSVPDIGGKPSIGDMGGKPTIDASAISDTGKLPDGSSTHPDLSGGYDPGGGGSTPGGGSFPGTGGLDDEEFSSGLAGAGGGGAPGLGSGFGGGGLGSSGLGGAGGLGSGGGLGSAGGGAGTGMLAGGGALGRPVSPNMGPMMGGGAAGAGRGGGGRGGGGRLGAGGKLGAGGMAPGMGGAPGAGAGRGGAARGAGGAGAGARGAGARGAGALGAGGGAGYGEEDAPRNTWLEEDEDVWGADDGGTAGILR
ncbi:WXG100 family type VII secretion target [Micromonospora vulcania]|uniref:WXG100 family type VII secretion target n=1 Tax=Micromonospora vulcania TaxID=1441873 RepID=A0ABW1HE68_9ACTN